MITHRIISEWLDGKLTKRRLIHYQKETLIAADRSSETEISAVETEREWTSYKICEYMEGSVGREFEGFISSVTSFGLFVQLPNTVEGLIHVTNLNDDYYIYDEIGLRLYGRSNGKEFKIGQRMKVLLTKVDKDLMQIDFAIAESASKDEVKKKYAGKKRRNKSSGSKQKSKA